MPLFPTRLRRLKRARAAIPAAAIVTAVLTGAAACASTTGSPNAPSATARSGASAPGAGAHGSAQPARVPPLPSGTALYPAPDPGLYSTAALLKASGQRALAGQVLALAKTPAAFWAAGQAGEMPAVSGLVRAAGQEHAVPVIVAYNLPDRDACGKFSGSSGPGPDAYRTWIDQLAGAVGTGTAIVIVEPDAVPDIVNGCVSGAVASQRYALLSYAMTRLGGLPNADVYLDAGNPGITPDPARLAAPLTRAGVRKGKGFTANISNFQWTHYVVQWSQWLESALGGGLGAVIDTSRNGSGPYTGPLAPQWCNPPGRTPGPAPQVAPGAAGIDAYLWIKDPGLSDGSCNGGPAAGQYWPAYAKELAGGLHGQ